jgi:hypothetical protein
MGLGDVCPVGNVLYTLDDLIFDFDGDDFGEWCNDSRFCRWQSAQADARMVDVDPTAAAAAGPCPSSDPNGDPDCEYVKYRCVEPNYGWDQPAVTAQYGTYGADNKYCQQDSDMFLQRMRQFTGVAPWRDKIQDFRTHISSVWGYEDGPILQVGLSWQVDGEEIRWSTPRPEDNGLKPDWGGGWNSLAYEFDAYPEVSPSEPAPGANNAWVNCPEKLDRPPLGIRYDEVDPDPEDFVQEYVRFYGLGIRDGEDPWGVKQHQRFWCGNDEARLRTRLVRIETYRRQIDGCYGCATALVGSWGKAHWEWHPAKWLWKFVRAQPVRCGVQPARCFNPLGILFSVATSSVGAGEWEVQSESVMRRNAFNAY